MLLVVDMNKKEFIICICREGVLSNHLYTLYKHTELSNTTKALYIHELINA